MYFNLPTRQGAPGEGPMGDGRVVPQFPIVSPGKIILKSVFVSDLTSTRSGKPVSYTEYKPTFAVCGGIQIEFGHTGPLSDRINAAIKTAPPRNCQEYSTGPDTVRGCNYELNLQLDAGEPIGFNSGRAFGFDFGAYDSSAPQQKFAQPERYGFEGRYNVCPLDLFEPNARAKFYSYLGQLVSQTKIQLRTSEPLCGTPMQDVAGTAQGNWFVNPKEPNPEDNNLALVYDNIDPTKPVLSVGVSVKGLASNTYSFARKSSGAINREFSAIKPDGQVYCFEQLVKGQFASQPVDAITILVALTNAETLRLEARQASPCNASALTFSANAATFYR
ncbi:MAG: hypothetical protein HY257_05995 [Chloroflexi bacterium]|nr:hypothetical protein [Chloroflexota bacterium]